MENFTFCTPTKILFGRHQEENVGKEIKNYHGTKVLIVYGQKSIEKTGLLSRLLTYLDNEQLDYVLCGGVEPNPKLSFVCEAIKKAKEENIDFVLAVGGGSAIDAAKLIATGFYYQGNPFDFNEKKACPHKALPLGVVLTIAAAGSEMSSSCVITDDSRHKKTGFNSEFNRPLFAIENPEITFTVSKYQTACGIVDILMHTLERYFSPSSELECADDIAIGLLKSVMKAAYMVMENPTSYEARANLMLTSSLSHNGITGIGKNISMPVHQLEHALSGLYDFVAHGAGLSVLFPAWSMVYYQYSLPKFVRLAVEVMGVEGNTDSETAYLGIVAIQKFFHSLGMPITLSELGIESADTDALLNLLFDNRDCIMSAGATLDRQSAQRIFSLCQKEIVYEKTSKF